MRLVFRCLLLYVPSRYEQAAHIGFRSRRYYMPPIGARPASSGSLPYGFNIHGVVFDELHTQPNRKLFDVMTKGSGDARMQPLYF